MRGFPFTIGKVQDAGLCRRSLKLLFGDWIPHEDIASEGCLDLPAGVGLHRPKFLLEGSF